MRVVIYVQYSNKQCIYISEFLTKKKKEEKKFPKVRMLKRYIRYFLETDLIYLVLYNERPIKYQCNL